MHHTKYAFALLCASCGAPPIDASAGPLEDGGAMHDAGPALTPPASGMQLHVTPYTMAPGDESVVCQVLSASHPAMHLSAYEVSERFGMHHLTLYYGPPGVADPCSSALNPVFLQQRAHSRTDLSGGAPEYRGATLEIPAGSFAAKVHAINTTDAPATIEAWINLETISTATIPLSFLSLSAGNKNMAIPAHTATTYSGAASPLKDMTIVAMASHTHAATTEERASYGGSVVYRSDNWEEPTEGYFNSTTAPLVVKAGTTLSWACDINNTTDGVLRYSDHALTAEMCNLTGFVKGTTPWAVAAP